MRGLRSSPRRSPRTSPGCALSSRSRASPSRSARSGVNERYRSAQLPYRRPERDLLPAVDARRVAIVFGYGGWLVYRRHDTPAPCRVRAVPRTSSTLSSSSRALHFVDKIVGVLDEKPQVVDRPTRPTSPGSMAGSRVSSATPELPEVLHGLELEAPAGTPSLRTRACSRRSRSALRGSTPIEGSITVDGHDLRKVTQRSLRLQLGIVPQEGFLFSGDGRQNIAFGRPEGAARGDRACRPHRRRAFVRRGVAGGLRHAPRRARRARLSPRPAPARCVARALLADPRS